MLVYGVFAVECGEAWLRTYARTLLVSLPNTCDVETYFGEVYRQDNFMAGKGQSSFYQFGERRVNKQKRLLWANDRIRVKVTKIGHAFRSLWW